MTPDQQSPDKTSDPKPSGRSRQEAARDRLAAALRENLKRRKAQARERRDVVDPQGPKPGEPV